MAAQVRRQAKPWSDRLFFWSDIGPALAWQDKSAWTPMSILNTARSAAFSSECTIVEYCDDIWDVHPVTINI